MMMVREQDVSFFVAPAIDFVWYHSARARVDAGAAARSLAAAAATFALVFLPQAIAYVILNGHVGPPRLVSRKMNWLSPHAGQILLSPGHGLFFWTPLMLLVVAGLVLLVRRLRRTHDISLGRPGALAFGQRRFVGSSALFTLGLAAVLARWHAGWRSTAVHALVAVAVWWNLALIAQFATGLMDRQRLALKKNAYDAFVTVPAMAPRLAYRYLFDRSSFYQNPQ
jgi:hypothetical protein